MGAPAAERAAEAVADILGWDERRVLEETAAYQRYLVENHRFEKTS